MKNAALYDVDARTISEHIKKINAYGELAESATIRKFRTVQTEGSCQENCRVGNSTTSQSIGS
jgi:hypothetical protein